MAKRPLHLPHQPCTSRARQSCRLLLSARPTTCAAVCCPWLNFVTSMGGPMSRCAIFVACRSSFRSVVQPSQVGRRCDTVPSRRSLYLQLHRRSNTTLSCRMWQCTAPGFQGSAKCATNQIMLGIHALFGNNEFFLTCTSCTSYITKKNGFLLFASVRPHTLKII